MHENNGGRGATRGAQYKVDFDQMFAAIDALDQVPVAMESAPIQGMRLDFEIAGDEATDGMISSVSEHLFAVAQGLLITCESDRLLLHQLAQDIVSEDASAAEQLRRMDKENDPWATK